MSFWNLSVKALVLVTSFLSLGLIGWTSPQVFELPQPRLKGRMSLEETLAQRRSIRSFKEGPLKLSELSQLLWAMQGITDPRGLRTAPSAGATYPLEIYVVVSNIQGLSPGVYHYMPQGHGLERIAEGDKRQVLYEAALRQAPVKTAPLVVVIAAEYERTVRRYGERGIRYVHMEAGHVAQNLCLQAVALGLGTVPIGAFEDEEVKNVLGLPEVHKPLYLIPVGRR